MNNFSEYVLGQIAIKPTPSSSSPPTNQRAGILLLRQCAVFYTKQPPSSFHHLYMCLCQGMHVTRRGHGIIRLCCSKQKYPLAFISGVETSSLRCIGKDKQYRRENKRTQDSTVAGKEMGRGFLSCDRFIPFGVRDHGTFIFGTNSGTTVRSKKRLNFFLCYRTNKRSP